MVSRRIIDKRISSIEDFHINEEAGFSHDACYYAADSNMRIHDISYDATDLIFQQVTKGAHHIKESKQTSVATETNRNVFGEKKTTRGKGVNYPLDAFFADHRRENKFHARMGEREKHISKMPIHLGI